MYDTVTPIELRGLLRACGGVSPVPDDVASCLRRCRQGAVTCTSDNEQAPRQPVLPPRVSRGEGHPSRRECDGLQSYGHYRVAGKLGKVYRQLTLRWS